MDLSASFFWVGLFLYYSFFKTYSTFDMEIWASMNESHMCKVGQYGNFSTGIWFGNYMYIDHGILFQLPQSGSLIKVDCIIGQQ